MNRGWAPLGSESLAYSLGVDAPPDLFEAFNIGAEHADANIWPEHLDGFRVAMETYSDAVGVIARRLSMVMATALDLPADFFVIRTSRAPDTLRVTGHGARSASVRLADADLLHRARLVLPATTDLAVSTAD